MQNKPSRSDILRDVAQAIIASGYAVTPGYEIPQRTRIASRASAHEIIARDDRLYSHTRHTKTALIHDVMHTFGVSKSNAKAMISRARKLSSAVD